MQRTVGLRWIVAGLVLATLVPLGVFAGLSIQQAWRQQLDNVDQQNVANVRAISVAIDQHVEKTTAALDVLGELHALDNPDLPAFESLAGRMLAYQANWTAILLATPDGQLLDGVPDRVDGAARTSGIPWARATASARRPTVSDLIEVAGVAGRSVIVATPVMRQGKVTSVLGARVRSESFSAILRQQQTSSKDAMALIGSDNRLIARSRDEAAYVGTLANGALIELKGRTPEASLRTTSRDGVASYAAFSRSPGTGLTVALGVPADEVDAPIRRILWSLASAWLVVLALGAGGALLLGQVIIRAMSSASRAAMALARGETVTPPSSRIAEVDQLASSLRLASQTLDARNHERDEASRLKDEFLMTISHELRTPLTAICGWARMMSTGQVRDAQRPRAVDAIERNANALQQLVDDLLDVSRIVSGKLRLDVRPIALNDVVLSAVEAVRPAAYAKNIQIVTDLDPQGASATGDPGRLQQVLWNLLSNAVKFTPSAGRIDITCRRAGDNVELVVRDTGVGVEPEFLPHVFERFRQGKSGTTRAHGGLGLGLSIVRHLVELHGGIVTGENNVPPPGATFRVVLPAGVPTYPAAAGWPATSASTPTSPRSVAR